MHLKGVACEIAYWIQLTENKIQRQPYFEHSPKYTGNFSTGELLAVLQVLLSMPVVTNVFWYCGLLYVRETRVDNGKRTIARNIYGGCDE
jgi:hypothetical protein